MSDIDKFLECEDQYDGFFKYIIPHLKACVNVICAYPEEGWCILGSDAGYELFQVSPREWCISGMNIAANLFAPVSGKEDFIKQISTIINYEQ